MLSSSRSGNVINQAQWMEPNYLTRPEICHGFPKLNSLATSAGTSASATGWEKMLRCQWEGGTQRRPRTHTLSNHSFLALVAWRMNVAKENPHFESSCIERNKSRKSVSTLKCSWTDFSLIECKTVEKWGYFERSDEIKFWKNLVTIKNPMPFRIENHCVRVEHAEKARSFTKSGLAKIAQWKPIFINCGCALYREFSKHEKT